MKSYKIVEQAKKRWQFDKRKIKSNILLKQRDKDVAKGTRKNTM